MKETRGNHKSAEQGSLEAAKEQLDAFEQNVKDLTLDRMNEAPKREVDQQTKLSSREIANSKDIYLKPERTITRRDKFNENYRNQYNFDKELVCFIAENREIIGEAIEMWTGKYAGVPLEFWKVPVNKPIWGPRYLAEQIKKCCYHRLVMKENIMTEHSGYGQMYGSMAADTTVQRLDAVPASTRKSVFMGASGF